MSSALFPPSRLPLITILLSLTAGILSQTDSICERLSEPYIIRYVTCKKSSLTPEMRSDFDAVERIWRSELSHSPTNVFEASIQSMYKRELAHTLFNRSRYMSEPPSPETESLYIEAKQFEEKSSLLWNIRGYSRIPIKDQMEFEIAQLYAAQGRDAEANQAFTRVYTSVSQYGEKWNDMLKLSTTEVARVMSQFYKSRGRYADAENIMLDSIKQETDGCAQKYTEQQLGSLYVREGRYTEAAALLKRASEGGADDRLVFVSGLNAWLQGKDSEAAKQLTKSLKESRAMVYPGDDIIVGQDGSNHKTFSDALLALGSLYVSTGNSAKAAPLFRESISLNADLLRGQFRLSATVKEHAKKSIEYAHRLLEREHIANKELATFVLPQDEPIYLD